jgi:vacuolar protein sorting-associated protein 72
LRSKDGVTQIAFPEGHLPSVFNLQPTPYPKPLVCAVTGKPAKYIDPLTKKPYAGIEEFKILQKEHAA